MPVVDLFCGCGGLSKGFELAGFDVVAAFDGWQSAITCYNANFDHDALLCDLNNVENAVATIQQLAPNVIIGGPPCQEFSNAGKRQEGERADLTYKYADIVTQVEPDFFVMENVPRARESRAYARARELYKASNYGLTEVVLDASRCGVPQKRSRFFCIGALNAPDNFLLDSIFEAYGDKETTVRQYFEAQNTPLEIDDFYRHPTTYSRRAIFSVDNPSPTVRGVNRPKPPTYRHHEKDSVGAEEMNNIRSLTLRERATIQTFPTDYVFDVQGITNGDLEQMVGNAVPVLLARFVAERLHNYMNQDNQLDNNKKSFAEWLRVEKGYTSDRSISDVFSRIHRAQKLLPDKTIDKYFIVDLQETEKYKSAEVSVKSQIKKAINLWLAFQEQAEDHE